MGHAGSRSARSAVIVVLLTTALAGAVGRRGTGTSGGVAAPVVKTERSGWLSGDSRAPDSTNSKLPGGAEGTR